MLCITPKKISMINNRESTKEIGEKVDENVCSKIVKWTKKTVHLILDWARTSNFWALFVGQWLILGNNILQNSTNIEEFISHPLFVWFTICTLWWWLLTKKYFEFRSKLEQRIAEEWYSDAIFVGNIHDWDDRLISGVVARNTGNWSRFKKLCKRKHLVAPI